MAVGSVGGAAIRDFGLRFNLVGVLPSAVAVISVLVLIRATNHEEPFGLDAIAGVFAGLGWSGAVALLIAALIVAFVFQPLQYGMVQLVEGYWPSNRLLSWLARRRTARHVSRRSAWEDAADLDFAELSSPSARNLADWTANRLRMSYPEPNRVMPTGLGNVLRAAEDRPRLTYGIRAIDLWPRAYMVMPADRLALIENGIMQLDIAVRYFVTFLAVGCSMIAILVVQSVAVGVHLGWFVVPVVFLSLSGLSYRGAVSKAVDHGIDIEVTFDLHRFDILEAMRIPAPEPDTERATFANLSLQVEGQLLPEEWLDSYVGVPTDVGVSFANAGSVASAFRAVCRRISRGMMDSPPRSGPS